MQSCHFAKSVIEHGSGRFLLQHSLLPFCWLSCSRLYMLQLCHSSQCKILATLQLSRVHLGDLRLLIRVQNKITAFSLNL